MRIDNLCQIINVFRLSAALLTSHIHLGYAHLALLRSPKQINPALIAVE
jgi:hypothetical protein